MHRVLKVSVNLSKTIPVWLAVAFMLLAPGTAKAQYYYDIVVYGGGLGGVAAAIQAKRTMPSAAVAIFEPTDTLGGQAVASGVTTVDLDGQPATGIWGEFVSGVTNYYTPWYNPSVNPLPTLAFEPRIGRQLLTNMIPAGVNVIYGKSVAYSFHSSQSIYAISFTDGSYVYANYFIDASEHGDLIRVDGQLGYSGYRAGNLVNPSAFNFAKVQNITWTTVIKQYPLGVPASIDPLLAGPPPGYSSSLFDGIIGTDANNISSGGTYPFGNSGPYPFGFYWNLGYRFTPNTNPQSGSIIAYPRDPGGQETRGNINLQGANDWLYSGFDLISPSNRQSTECAAKLRTLQLLYYLRSKGLSWSVANDEGYNTPYNQTATNACANIPASWLPIAYNLPPLPYVRESVRGIGPYTMTGIDVFRKCNGCSTAELTSFPTSISSGGYFADLHDGFYLQNATQLSDLEPIDRGNTGLPTGEPIYDTIPNGYNGHASTNHSGPFEIPYESLFSSAVPNLIFAGKNISQTRVVNGSTRLHPTEMRTGQAAGMIAALAMQYGTTPSNLNPYFVQDRLVKAGQAISAINFTDVPPTHQYWAALQLASARRYLLGGGNGGTFSPGDFITRAQAAAGLARRFAWPLGYRLDRNANLPTPAQQRFTDVPPSNQFYKHVGWIADAGITLGCSPTTFCPDDIMNRGQLAAFIARAMNLNLSVPPQTTDVPATDPFYSYINAVVYYGIMRAPGGIFGESQNVTRGEFAQVIADSATNALPVTGNALQLYNNVPGN